MSNLLVIGDLHEPFSRVGYFEFCKSLYQKYQCNKVLFIGDVVECHSISFHPKSPQMPNASKEIELAHKAVEKWYKTFPNAKICIGNHDSRIVRLAETVNIPEKCLLSFSELWKTPEWEWNWNFKIDGVHYTHGQGITTGAIHPAYTMMRNMAMSVVIGHKHTAAGIKWLCNPYQRLFGMDVGSGIDDNALAFEYGRFLATKSVISAAVVINGMPYLELMPMSKGEKYHDSKIKKEKDDKSRRN